jgi:hypothetical protein
VNRTLRGLLETGEVAARLTWLRLRLPRLLDEATLPGLLARLAPHRDVAPVRAAAHAAIPSRRTLRGLSLGEAVVHRLRVVPDTCLYRSFARYAVLRRAGVPAELVLGVRARDGAIEGHAWIEIDGEPFRESRAPDLVENFRYPPPAT